MVPEVLKLFQDKRDKEHELALLQMQSAMVDKKADNDLENTLVNASAQQSLATQESYRADMRATLDAGYGWVAALAASVRPVITYLFFFLYVAVKYSQIQLLVNPTLPWQTAITFSQAIGVAWSEEDTALFSAIMAFWFSERLLRKR